MTSRRNNQADQILWSRVAATVRPLEGRRTAPVLHSVPEPRSVPRVPISSHGPQKKPKPVVAHQAQPSAMAGLDGGWDKRLTRGSVVPDRTVDLHGLNLAAAHARLDRALADAVQQGVRVLLLVTGKPAPDNPRLPPTSRGVIRASVIDWLNASGHAGRIAAVRPAHPRHGGQGALYIIFRRPRASS